MPVRGCHLFCLDWRCKGAIGGSGGDGDGDGTGDRRRLRRYSGGCGGGGGCIGFGSLYHELLQISRYNSITECPGTVGLSRLPEWRMRPISRLSDVFANVSAGLRICLYSLSTCSWSNSLGSTMTSFLACCISTCGIDSIRDFLQE